MKTKEEILNSHPYLKTWIENPDDSVIEVCNIEQVLWAMEEYASQGMPEISETEMETYFLNHYNCFANDEDTVPAMTRSEAIEMCKWAINRLK